MGLAPQAVKLVDPDSSTRLTSCPLPQALKEHSDSRTEVSAGLLGLSNMEDGPLLFFLFVSNDIG